MFVNATNLHSYRITNVQYYTIVVVGIFHYLNHKGNWKKVWNAPFYGKSCYGIYTLREKMIQGCQLILYQMRYKRFEIWLSSDMYFEFNHTKMGVGIADMPTHPVPIRTFLSMLWRAYTSLCTRNDKKYIYIICGIQKIITRNVNKKSIKLEKWRLMVDEKYF